MNVKHLLNCYQILCAVSKQLKLEKSQGRHSWYAMYVSNLRYDTGSLQHNSKAMSNALLAGEGKNTFQRGLQTRLKYFKFQTMPNSYLSSMFVVRLRNLRYKLPINLSQKLLKDIIELEEQKVKP